MTDVTLKNTIDWIVQDRIALRPEDEWDGTEARFYHIALELQHLEALQHEGWWGDYSYCMYAETILRDFGPLVADAAIAEATSQEMDDSCTMRLLRCVISYLEWQQAVGPSSGDEITCSYIERAQGTLRDVIQQLSIDEKIKAARQAQSRPIAAE